MFKRDSITFVLGALMLITIAGFLTSCSDDDNPITPTQQPEYQSILPAANTYVGGAQAAVITAQSLFDNMNDGNAANDYLVVSVRSAADYAKGHVPGAINIFWKEIATTENLAKLSKDKKIAVYCYTGHTGAVAATILNCLGYEAYNLKYGIGAWTRDTNVRVAAPFNEATDAHDFAVETTINNPATTYTIPTTNFTESQDAAEILRAAGHAYASAKTPTITAQALFDNLNDGNTANDPVILSVRSAADYAKGHIPGAINIPWKEIAKDENLKKLNPAKQIVVYCYTGHTAGIATTVLNMLGYDAINMKFGIMSWTRDANVRAATPFTEATDSHDFAVTTGANP